MNASTRIVDYEKGGETFEGFLAMPAGTPQGVIVVAHAWGGQSGFEQDKAKLMAEWGYAGFALDVYGKGKRGETNEECEALMTPLASNRPELQARLQRALEVAKAESGTDNAAAIGFCFGGLSVLDMARTNMALKGVVSFHGLFGAPDNTADKINPKVLALHGWEDPMATPDDVMDFSKEMTGANADWQLHAYGATMHAFTNPQANNPDFGTVYDPGADRRSFATCKDFLKEVLS